VIELDGGQHAQQMVADAARDGELAAHGYRVIRFWNRDVLDNIEGVLQTIRNVLGKAPTSPRPSPPPGAERE
jgi:very-short-patch-repair endonuclease